MAKEYAYENDNIDGSFSKSLLKILFLILSIPMLNLISFDFGSWNFFFSL